MLPVNIYPYMNLEDLNLDYILKKLMKLETDVQDFVEMNAIKYGDPIQWNITTQYEKNTIVIDPATGSAYLSVRPVPAGIDISRTEYWTEVFNLSALVQDAVRNLTEHDAGISTVATFASAPGDWIMWKDILYVATSQITPGDAYTVGGNIARLTVEEAIKDIAALIDQNALAIAAEAETRAREIEAEAEARALADQILDDKIEALESSGVIITPEQFGAAGDGVTDDTAALNAMYQAAAGKICVLRGTYLVDGHTSNVTSEIDFYSSGVQVTSNTKTYFTSGASVKMKPSNTATSNIFTLIGLENVEIHGGEFVGDYGNHQHISGTTDEWCHGITAYACKNLTIEGVKVRECYGDGIYIGQFPYYGGNRPNDNHSKNVTLRDIIVDHCGRNGITIGECDGFLIDNVDIRNVARTSPMAAIDVEQEGDYDPILRRGVIMNVREVGCGSDSVKITLVRSGSIRVQNVTAEHRIYCEANETSTYIDNVECPLFVSQCAAEVFNSKITPLRLFTTKTVTLIGCRLTMDNTAESAKANLYADRCIFTNTLFLGRIGVFSDCMFIYDGRYTSPVALMADYDIADFDSCQFNYGSYTRDNSWIIEDEGATGILSVTNCKATGARTQTFTRAAVINRSQNNVINGNAYFPYGSMSTLAPASGCVNFNA